MASKAKKARDKKKRKKIRKQLREDSNFSYCHHYKKLGMRP